MKLDSSMTQAVQESEGRSVPLSFTPSPQQEAVRAWVEKGQGNAIVNAVAGSGKTTTLRYICRYLKGTVIFTAYNRKIADEIAAKLAEDGLTQIQAKTFHAIGFGAIKRAYPSAEMKPDKMQEICEALNVDEKWQGAVKKLVGLAKNHALGIATEDGWINGPLNAEMLSHIIEKFDLLGDLPEGDEDNIREEKLVTMTLMAMHASNSAASESFDFDDMIYIPLLHGLSLYKVDHVLVDEAQDTNPARRLMAERMMIPGRGRAIFVGDPRQAIYGFTGADHDSLEIIGKRFHCIELPLTISFRCPKAVVRHAQQWVSHIEAAENAPEGQVLTIDEFEFRGQSTHDEAQEWLTRDVLNKDSAILCRYTKPLVSLAFELIRHAIPCHVEGKEIGRGLIALIKRWKTIKTLSELSERLIEYQTREIAKLRFKKQEAKIEALNDRIETIFVIMDNLPDPVRATIYDLTRQIESLFGDTPEGGKSRDCTLSTVHKAKGREWNTVFLWGRNKFMPSKYATQDWQLLQEDNLIYVAVTRAKQRLVEVDVV